MKQVYSGISQSQGQICTLLLELLQIKGGVARVDGYEAQRRQPSQNAVAGFIYTSGEVRIRWHLPFRSACLSSHPVIMGAAGIKPLCHWVSKSYLSGHEVIWSHSSLFKNGALPHQLVLRGLVISEGAAEGR